MKRAQKSGKWVVLHPDLVNGKSLTKTNTEIKLKRSFLLQMKIRNGRKSNLILKINLYVPKNSRRDEQR